MNNTIILKNGNCLEQLENLDKNQKYIIVTDPPFNVGYKYNSYNDNLDEDSYYEFLYSVLHKYPSVVIHYPEQLYKLSWKLEEIPTRVISWVYNSNTPRQHRDIAFFRVKPDFTKAGQPYKNPTDKRIAKRIAEGKEAKLYDWWNINQVKNVSKDKTGHPCQMPLEVMTNIIKLLPTNYTIIDPFMGSGTTGVACVNLNRNFIGIELDSEYFKIAEARIENIKQPM